jgi:hypothetical protein
MTKEEAINILAVPEGASENDINQKFAELQNDFQIRLTNAPTPNLKKLYQKNISELKEAKGLLLGEVDSVVSDLPSAQPNFNINSGDNFTKVENVKPNDKSNSESKEDNSKTEVNNKWLISTIGLGVILLATIIFTVIDINRRSSEAETQQDELVETQNQLTKSNELLENYTSVFENGKFKVKNKGNKAFTVEWIIINYLDAKGDVQKYFDFTNKSIRPGSTESFSKVKGGEVVWDGSVVFFVCSVKSQGVQSYQSGVWSNESDKGVLNWNWDN